jgi:hypothetical protein
MTAHPPRRVALAGLLGLLVLSAAAGPAFAGKPGGGGTASAFRVDDGAYASQTLAHQGSTTATWVRARCWQAGVLVYEQFARYGATGTAALVLGPTQMWPGGAATCTGEEGFWRNGTRWRVVSTDAFAVSG